MPQLLPSKTALKHATVSPLHTLYIYGPSSRPGPPPSSTGSSPLPAARQESTHHADVGTVSPCLYPFVLQPPRNADCSPGKTGRHMRRPAYLHLTACHRYRDPASRQFTTLLNQPVYLSAAVVDRESCVSKWQAAVLPACCVLREKVASWIFEPISLGVVNVPTYQRTRSVDGRSDLRFSC